MLSRSYYSAPILKFLEDDPDRILGEIVRNHSYALEELQRNAWLSQIAILKRELFHLRTGRIIFEYSIPRMGKRADVILLTGGTVFVLEFKVGAKYYEAHAIDQVLDYAIDLKNFHEQSHERLIVPILVATGAPTTTASYDGFEDGVLNPVRIHERAVGTTIDALLLNQEREEFDYSEWEYSRYRPTPTIVEAAQALYQGHRVEDISRSDSSAINLSATSEAITDIIEEAKRLGHKSICFVTGVPGAGKTLAGLNIANLRMNAHEDEHAVFLSGNGPLVKVLQEALARDEVQRANEEGRSLPKRESLGKTRAFIQNIHHFRDDALQNSIAPVEKVAVFDEAQRAWTLEQTQKFMQQKRGQLSFDMSEPQFLMSVMDRHEDWAIIVCLVGGGQEINTGEAGIAEWFEAIKLGFPSWKVYRSSRLDDSEFAVHQSLLQLEPDQLVLDDRLHLGVSVRSFRSERVSAFVKALLDVEQAEATQLLSELIDDYPIVITRRLDQAKQWLRERARGTERTGLIASSRAHRLRPYGIDVRHQIDPKIWFLNGKDDIRSSYFLEDVATEFDIQGLELDWSCVAWDADLRFRGSGWEYKDFRGTKWININDATRRLYLKNAYRVLLTRARQGMVLFVPEGDSADQTRRPEFYDGTFRYLKKLGIPVL